jgi:hypothetical protein
MHSQNKTSTNLGGLIRRLGSTRYNDKDQQIPKSRGGRVQSPRLGNETQVTVREKHIVIDSIDTTTEVN